MGKKSQSTTTTYGNTTTKNPYATATTNNSGTTASLNAGTALDTVYNFVNKNIGSLLDEYLNPNLNSTTNQAKLNQFTTTLGAEAYKNLENNIISPLSERNMIRSSQATDLYNNLADTTTNSLAAYVNELLEASQDNTASMLNNLLAAYMQGYDVVSCWSALFDETMEKIVAIKKRPGSHDEIVKLAKRRSPLCHAATVFRRSAVLKAGNYQHCNLYEDYHLWVRMLMSECRFSNVQEILYNVRTSVSMVNRRGGWKYAVNELKTFFFFYKIGFYSISDLGYNFITHFPIRILPICIRTFFINAAWNHKVKLS